MFASESNEFSLGHRVLKCVCSTWREMQGRCLEVPIMVTRVLLPKQFFSFRLVAAPESTEDLTTVCGPAVRALPSHCSGTSSVTASKGSFLTKSLSFYLPRKTGASDVRVKN